MNSLSHSLVQVCDDREGRGIYELAAMLGVENDRMLRALWVAQRRGDVIPMVVHSPTVQQQTALGEQDCAGDGYVLWYLVPGGR